MVSKEPTVKKVDEDWTIRWEGFLIVLNSRTKKDEPMVYVSQDHPAPTFSLAINHGR